MKTKAKTILSNIKAKKEPQLLFSSSDACGYRLKAASKAVESDYSKASHIGVFYSDSSVEAIERAWLSHSKLDKDDLTKPRHVPKTWLSIECKDFAGVTRNMSIASWARLTGKSKNAIRDHYAHKRRGENKMTNQEIVGVVRYRGSKPAKLPIVDSKDRNSYSMLNDFLKRRLV
jgi:hypothetical protein